VRQLYTRRISHTISSIFNKFGYRSAFNTINPLRSISEVKDSSPIEKKSDVYKLECEDYCDVVYIGQTGRPSDVRIRDALIVGHTIKNKIPLSLHIQ